MKFKVGDMVKIVTIKPITLSKYKYLIGHKGQVIYVSHDSHTSMYKVKVSTTENGTESLYFEQEELQLLNKKPFLMSDLIL